MCWCRKVCMRAGNRFEKNSSGRWCSANKHLQTALADAVGGIEQMLVSSNSDFSSDNAVMIACRGYFMYQNGEYSPLDLNAVPSLKLG